MTSSNVSFLSNCQKSPKTPRLTNNRKSCRWHFYEVSSVEWCLCSARRGGKSSLFPQFPLVYSSHSHKQNITLKRFNYFLPGSLLWPTDWTRRSNDAAMPKMCQSLSNKMSYLEYFYLFWVHYQYLHHRSLFAKSVIWGQFVRINHKSLPVTVNKHQEVRLWNQTQTEAFCSTKQLQTIKCNCYFAFRLNENQQRGKKNRRHSNKHSNKSPWEDHLWPVSSSLQSLYQER